MNSYDDEQPTYNDIQQFEQEKLYYNLENAIKDTVDTIKLLYDKTNVKIVYDVNFIKNYDDNTLLICSREQCPWGFKGWIIEEQQPVDTEHEYLLK